MTPRKLGRVKQLGGSKVPAKEYGLGSRSGEEEGDRRSEVGVKSKD